MSRSFVLSLLVVALSIISVSGCDLINQSDDEESSSLCPVFENGNWLPTSEMLQAAADMDEDEVQECAIQALAHAWTMDGQDDWTLDLTGIDFPNQDITATWVHQGDERTTGATLEFSTGTNLSSCANSSTCLRFFQGGVTVSGSIDGRLFTADGIWNVADRVNGCDRCNLRIDGMHRWIPSPGSSYTKTGGHD